MITFLDLFMICFYLYLTLKNEGKKFKTLISNNFAFIISFKRYHLIYFFSLSFKGKFLTCRTSEVKDKNVTFQRRNSLDEAEIDLNAVTNSSSSSNEETVNISGRVIKLDPQVHKSTIIYLKKKSTNDIVLMYLRIQQER